MSTAGSTFGVDAGMAIGVISGTDEDGFVTVVSGVSPTAVACLPLEHVRRSALRVGANVLFWRPAPDADTGVIMGVVTPPVTSSAAEVGPASDHQEDNVSASPPDTLVLEARSSLVLRVGDGSIEMRADGKILIRGRDLVSHAKRMNRIKGGAVSIN